MWNLEHYNDQLKNCYVPKINCPFGDNENQNLRPTWDAHRKWLIESKMLDSKEMIEKFLSTDTGLLTAYLYPRNNEKDFIFLNKISDWLFIIDDVYLERKKKDMDYVEDLFDENAPHDVFGDVLWTLLNEMYQTNPKSAIDLVKDTLHDWAKCVIDVNNTDDEDVSKMSIEEYCKYRFIDVGGLIVAVCNMVDYESFSDEIRETSEFNDLNYWYTTANLLINDIYSFKKETKSERLGNFIKIKTLQCGSIQDALNFSRDYLHECFQKMIEVSNRLLAMFPEDKVLRIYINRLKESTGGDIKGSSLCIRYAGNVYEREIMRRSV